MVAWTRAEEFFHDTFDPAAVVKIESALGANGKISLWDYTVWYAGDRSAGAVEGAGELVVPAHDELWMEVMGRIGREFGSERGCAVLAAAGTASLDVAAHGDEPHEHLHDHEECHNDSIVALSGQLETLREISRGPVPTSPPTASLHP